MPYLPPIYHSVAKREAEAARLADVERLQEILKRHLREERRKQKRQTRTHHGSSDTDADNEERDEEEENGRRDGHRSEGELGYKSDDDRSPRKSNYRKSADTARSRNSQSPRSDSFNPQKPTCSSARGLKTSSNTRSRSSASLPLPPIPPNPSKSQGGNIKSSPRSEREDGQQDSSSSPAESTLSHSASTRRRFADEDPSVEPIKSSVATGSRSASARDSNRSGRNTTQKGRTSSGVEVKDETTDSPSSSSPSYKAVAFVDDNEQVACPECGAKFSIHKHMRYRQHVFDCRLDHGRDPLMPLQVARKSHATIPKDEFATVVRPIQATMMTVDLFAGVPMSAKRSNRDVAEFIRASVAKWTKTLAASSGQLFTLQKPTTTSSSSPNTAHQKRGRQDNTTGGGGADSSSSGLDKHARVAGTSEQMEAAVNDALREAILEAAVIPAEGSTSKNWARLNLSGLSIPYRQASRIASILYPLDGSTPMPVRVIDLRGARFVGEESAQVFFASVMKSTSVEQIIVSSSASSRHTEEQEETRALIKIDPNEDEETGASASGAADSQGLARHLAKTRFHSSTILDHLASNASARVDDDEDRAFLAAVNAYHISVEDFRIEATEIANKVRAFAARLQQEELDARRQIAFLMAEARAEHDRKQAKIALKKSKATERLMFELHEEDRRREIETEAFNGVGRLLLGLERARRGLTVVREEAEARYRMKFAERENAFRCVVIKDVREVWYHSERLFLEEAAEVGKGDLLQLFIEELKLYKHQQDQHKLIAMWRKRQREELELVLRTEDRFRESIKKDEDNQFLTAKERFMKVIEAIYTKDRSQRAYVEDYERMRRKELEGAVNVFFETNFYFFSGKNRVLKALTRIQEHERSRLKALSEVPKVSVEGFKTKHRMLVFATPTPGHAPNDPTTVFGDKMKINCMLSPEWTAGFQNIQRHCRKAVDDERAAMVEYLNIIQRNYRVRADAASIALAPIDPDEPKVDEVIQIQKPTAVPITLRQAGRSGGVIGGGVGSGGGSGSGSSYGNRRQNQQQQSQSTFVSATAGSGVTIVEHSSEMTALSSPTTSSSAPLGSTSGGGGGGGGNVSRSVSNLAMIRAAMQQRQKREQQQQISGGGAGGVVNSTTLSLSLKGPLTAQDLYSADEDIAEAQQEVLRLRTAWHDKATVSEIKRQKERIVSAKIIVQLSQNQEDIEAANAVPCEHNLLSSVAMKEDLLVTIIADDKEVSPVNLAALAAFEANTDDFEGGEDGDRGSSMSRPPMFSSAFPSTTTVGSFMSGGGGGNDGGNTNNHLAMNPSKIAGSTSGNKDGDYHGDGDDRRLSADNSTGSGSGEGECPSAYDSALQRFKNRIELNGLSYATKTLEVVLEPVTEDNEKRFLEQRRAVLGAMGVADAVGEGGTGPARASLSSEGGSLVTVTCAEKTDKSRERNGSLVSTCNDGEDHRVGGPLSSERDDVPPCRRGKEADEEQQPRALRYKPNGPLRPGVDMASISEALSTVLYRCSMAPSLYGNHSNVATHLAYRIELTVELCDAYTVSSSYSVAGDAPSPSASTPGTTVVSPASVLTPRPPPQPPAGGQLPIGASYVAATNAKPTVAPLSATFVLPTLADLYEPRQPPQKARHATLSHEGRIEVGVIPTLFTIDRTSSIFGGGGGNTSASTSTATSVSAPLASAPGTVLVGGAGKSEKSSSVPPSPYMGASSPPFSVVVNAPADATQDVVVLAPKVIVEGQMDGIPVIRAMGKLNDNWVTVVNPTDERGNPTGRHAELRRRDDPRNNVGNAQIIGGLCGGTIMFEVLGDGVSNFDRLSLADEPGTIRFETVTAGRAKSIERIFIHDIFFGTISEGVAQVTQSVVPSTAAPAHGPRFIVKIDPRYPATLVDESAQRLVKQLRYHNYQEGPAEGERNMRVTVETADGARSAFDSKFEVEAIDKPTELRLPYEKLVHRVPCYSVPPFMRQSLTDIPVPIFPQALVLDEDTDRFSGGWLRLTMNNGGSIGGQAVTTGLLSNPATSASTISNKDAMMSSVSGPRGDAIAICPDSHLHNFIEEALGISPSISVAEGSHDIMYEGRVVATIVEGEVLRSRSWSCGGNGERPERDYTFIHIAFANDDKCSIAAVQAIIRSLVYVNVNPAYNAKGHPMHPKDFTLDCQIQDNEQSSRISKFVSIRGGSHTVQLLEKGSTLDYKENSPPTKLGYFDLNKDSINPVNNFGGGYVLVSIVEGYDSDVIQLKQEEGEFTFIEPRRARGGGGVGILGGQSSRGMLTSTLSSVRFSATPQASVALQSTTTTIGKSMNAFTSSASFASVPASPRTAGGSSGATAATMANINTAAERLITQHLSQYLKDASPERYDPQTMRPLAITFAGMGQSVMATCVTFRGGLLIQLAPDTRRDQVQRRHVMSLLRNITYFHNGRDVKSTQKVARVFVSDSMANTPTQALVQINLEVADDITEIRCKSPRRRIVQSLENNYPLLPYGRSLVHDDDTEYFDGGSLFVQCIAGSSKGDGFTIVPPHLQQLSGSSSASGGNTGVRLQRAMPLIPDLTVPMESGVVYNDFVKNFLDKEGRELAKVETSTRDGGVAEVKLVFPKNDPPIVSRNLVSYMMNSLLFGNQADRLRDNSRTFMVRIKDPENPAEGKLKLSLEVLPPLISFQPPSSSAGFEATVMCRLLTSPATGAGANPGGRIIVNIEKFTDLRAISAAPQLTISVSGSPFQLSKVRLHVPVTERECGLSLRDGKYIVAPGGVQVATLDQPDQHTAVISFAHIPASKSSALTRDKLQNLLRSVIVSNSEELETKGVERDRRDRERGVVLNEMAGFGEVVAFSGIEGGGETSTSPTNALQPHQSLSNLSPRLHHPAPPPSNFSPSEFGGDTQSVMGAAGGSSANGISLPRARNTSIRGGTLGGGTNRRQSLFGGGALGSSQSTLGGDSKAGGVGTAGTTTASYFFTAPSAEDDDDQYTLVVSWTIHDGSNETAIKTRLCPKRPAVGAGTGNSAIAPSAISRRESMVSEV